MFNYDWQLLANDQKNQSGPKILELRWSNWTTSCNQIMARLFHQDMVYTKLKFTIQPKQSLEQTPAIWLLLAEALSFFLSLSNAHELWWRNIGPWRLRHALPYPSVCHGRVNLAEHSISNGRGGSILPPTPWGSQPAANGYTRIGRWKSGRKMGSSKEISLQLFRSSLRWRKQRKVHCIISGVWCW